MGHMQVNSDLPWSLSVPSLLQTDEIASSNHKRERENDSEVTTVAKKALAESYIPNLSNDILRHIVQNYLDACSQIVTRFVNKRFHGITSFKSKKFCVLAAREGYLGLIIWSRSPFSRIHPPLKRATWVQAAVRGHVEVLEKLPHPFRLTEDIYRRSVLAVFAHLGLLDHPEAFRWFKEFENIKLCLENIPMGHLEVLKYLKSLKSKLVFSVGRLFTHLHERAKGEPWTDDIVHDVHGWVIEGDYPEVLTWLLENRAPPYFTEEALVECGRLSILKFALKLAKLDVTECLEWAAYYGNLKIMKWALANGARLEKACESAACGLHIDILEWLRAKGAPWDGSEFGFIANSGKISSSEKYRYLEVFKWNNAPFPEYLPFGLRDINKIGEIENKCLKWVVENQISPDGLQGTSLLDFLETIKLDSDTTSDSVKE